MRYEGVMENKTNYMIAVIVVAAISTAGVLLGKFAYADAVISDLKQEQVLKQRQSQDILPFEEILKAIRPQIDGELIETEFEIENGRPIYELKYIDASGRVTEIYVDAKTGRIVRKEDD